MRKILALRLFEDDGKRWQKSVKDLQLDILCVSQFTLYHRLKGNKPDFSAAMKGEDANQLYNHFLDRLRQSYDAIKIQGNLPPNIRRFVILIVAFSNVRWQVWRLHASAYRE